MDKNFRVKFSVLLRTLDVFYRLLGPNIYNVENRYNSVKLMDMNNKQLTNSIVLTPNHFPCQVIPEVESNAPTLPTPSITAV